MSNERYIAAPIRDTESAAFWEAADQEQLVLPKCTQCGRFHWYPRSSCPFCLAKAIEWTASRGEGQIYSVTTFRRTKEPFIVAYVELDEGPRLLTNIATEDAASVSIGQRVEVVFVSPSDEPARKIPFFRPSTRR